MNKIHWLAAAALLAASLPALSQAQAPSQDQPPQQAQDSTAQMATACKAIPPPQADGAVRPPPDFNSGYCWGAFTSLQSAATARDERNHALLGACVPADTTRMQLIGTFTRYADAHAELAQQDYFTTALAALREAWPCKAAHSLLP